MPISPSQLATGSASGGAWSAYPPPGSTIMCVPSAEESMIKSLSGETMRPASGVGAEGQRLALALAGRDHARLYDGSLTEGAPARTCPSSPAEARESRPVRYPGQA